MLKFCAIHTLIEDVPAVVWVVFISSNMYIMYIDESGDTTPLSRGGTTFLVLMGCVISEIDKINIEEKFRTIKKNYFRDADIEIKSNFLRYANPDVRLFSPLKIENRKQYNHLESEMTLLLQEIPVALFSVAIHKPMYWERAPSQHPYETAYAFLIERFQKFLESKHAYGICIIDPREGQVSKSFIGPELDHIHHVLRWDKSAAWYPCHNIIERVLFSTSDRTIGIQLADLYCYPLFHILSYDKKFAEYWRFEKMVLAKLQLPDGLKIFPEESKKGLRCFE